MRLLTRFFEGIYKLPSIYDIIWLLLFIYLLTAGQFAKLIRLIIWRQFNDR